MSLLVGKGDDGKAGGGRREVEGGRLRAEGGRLRAEGGSLRSVIAGKVFPDIFFLL